MCLCFEWLKDINVGDMVIISNIHGNKIDYVKRITKNQILIKGTSLKFRLSDGSIIGGSDWTITKLTQATKVSIENVAYEKLVKHVQNLATSAKYSKFSMKELFELKSIFESQTEKKNEV